MRKELGQRNGNSPNTSHTSLHKSHSWSNIKDRETAAASKPSPLGDRRYKFDNNLTVHVSLLP